MTPVPPRSGTPAPPPGGFTGLLDAVGSQPPGSSLRQCPAHPDTHPSLSGISWHILTTGHAR
jgi:hypothetical protein